MNKKGKTTLRVKIAAGALALVAFTGCVGVVGDGYGGEVVVPGPDVVLFGGGYERGPVVHEYSHRGFVSRGVAHPGGWRR